MVVLADGVSGFIAERMEAGNQNPLILLGMMADDSTSMRFFENYRYLMSAHNNVLDILKGSTNPQLFMVRTQYMHGKALAVGYQPSVKAPCMTAENYQLSGGSPLFVATRRIAWCAKRWAHNYSLENCDVVTFTLLFTDGHNRSSRATTAKDVCRVIRPMIKSGRHIFAGVGLKSPLMPDGFEPVFLEMGIPPQWILSLESGNQVGDAFARFGRLAVDSSVSRQRLDETRMVGFGDTQ